MARTKIVDEEELDESEEENSDEEDGVERPFSRNQIAKECGKSAFWVRSQETLGRLNPKKDSRGHHRFSQEDMDAALEIAGTVQSEGSELVRAGTDFTKVTVKHLESILRLAHEPATAVMQLLQEENARSRTQFEALWTKYVEVLGRYEEMLQSHAERELVKEQALSAERRKDRALEALMQNGPTLLNNLINKDKGLHDLMALLKSLDEEQLTALSEAGLITSQQLETIKKIRGTLV